MSNKYLLKISELREDFAGYKKSNDKQSVNLQAAGIATKGALLGLPLEGAGALAGGAIGARFGKPAWGTFAGVTGTGALANFLAARNSLLNKED